MPADPTPNTSPEDEPDPGAGLVDPRTIRPGPGLGGPDVEPLAGTGPGDAEAPTAPSRETPATRGKPGIVDPRPDLPTPEDLAP